MRRSPASDLVRLALIVAVIGVLALGSLYAYRSQTPAVPTVSATTAVADVQAGRVKTVAIAGGTATLTLNDGTIERTSVSERGDPLADAVLAYNGANPTRPVAFRYEPGSPDLSVVGTVLLSLLPVLLVLVLILFAAYVLARGRRPDAYASLARIADLRDRGVLTEDEFQREKRRLLR